MTLTGIVLSVLLFAGAAFLTVFGVRHLLCKGYCFNNAYIYASKDERESMDKTPYYKQSGIILLMVSGVFLLNLLQIVFKLKIFMYVSFVLIAAIFAYAVVSSIRLEKNNNSR